MPRNVIIIGGTSGVGLTTAHYLNDNNYRVIVAGRSKIETEISYFHIDVTSESSIKNFFSSIPFNQIDGIIYFSIPYKLATNYEMKIDFYHRNLHLLDLKKI